MKKNIAILIIMMLVANFTFSKNLPFFSGKDDGIINFTSDTAFRRYCEGCNFEECCAPPIYASATSVLKIGKISYPALNLIDCAITTAWVEGKSGYGEGESFIITFDAVDKQYVYNNSAYHLQLRNITDLFILNGYTKSEKTWQENARVKKN